MMTVIIVIETESFYSEYKTETLRQRFVVSSTSLNKSSCSGPRHMFHALSAGCQLDCLDYKEKSAASLSLLFLESFLPMCQTLICVNQVQTWNGKTALTNHFSFSFSNSLARLPTFQLVIKTLICISQCTMAPDPRDSSNNCASHI